MECVTKENRCGWVGKDDVSGGIQTNGIVVEPGEQLILYSTGSPAQGFRWHEAHYYLNR